MRHAWTCSIALFLGIASFQAVLAGDVYVRGYTRSNGTYVQPHYRSAPDGVFSNNWSTKGNANPYTGEPGTRVTPSYGSGALSQGGITGGHAYRPYVAQSETKSLPSSPVVSTFHIDGSAYASGQLAPSGSLSPQIPDAATRLVAERAALEAELRREQELDAQFRLAGERKIQADAATRKAEFEEQDLRLVAEARAAASKLAQDRDDEWQIAELARRQVEQEDAASLIAGFSRNLGIQENRTLAEEARQAVEVDARVAATQQRVSDQYRGDGLERYRDQRRKRADDWTRAQRAVQAKYAAQSREMTYRISEAQFRQQTITSLDETQKARAIAWNETLRRDKAENESGIQAASQTRRLAWELREQAQIAQARSQLETEILNRKGQFAERHTPDKFPSSVEPHEQAGRNDQIADTTSAPVAGGLTFGALLTALASVLGLRKVLA